MQACARVSQMGQDLCASKEKYRKLEHQYKELQKVKIQLEDALTVSRDGEDSMTMYFDRLTTYETTIKDLEHELMSLEKKNKNL